MSSADAHPERHLLLGTCPAGKRTSSFAIAMQKEGVLPSHVFNGIRKAGLTGWGVLICAIDSRSGQEDEVKMQVPLFKEPLLKPQDASRTPVGLPFEIDTTFHLNHYC